MEEKMRGEYHRIYYFLLFDFGCLYTIKKLKPSWFFPIQRLLAYLYDNIIIALFVVSFVSYGKDSNVTTKVLS